MAKSVDATKEDKDATAISNKKQESTELIVDHVLEIDNNLVGLQYQKMNELGLFQGAMVLLKSDKCREAVCVVQLAHGPVNRIQMNRILRHNLRVRLGDIVSIQRCHDVKPGEHILVLPVDVTVEGITSNLFDVYLKPYFKKNCNRPIHEGDVFIVRAAMHDVEFKVIKTKPSPYCAVTQYTDIQ